MLAVPYYAKDSLAARAEFSYSNVTIVLTLPLVLLRRPLRLANLYELRSAALVRPRQEEYKR
jgi:hypothetical protein